MSNQTRPVLCSATLQGRVLFLSERAKLSLLLALVLVIVFHSATALASPRATIPPWPENPIWLEHFDQPCALGTNIVDSSIWAESWSGWCLNRAGSTVAPWLVPMQTTTRFLVDPERGVIRFWYQPTYDSGTGPGSVATLLTLVSTNGTSRAVWWTLAVSGDGTEGQLLCQTADGPAACLSAPLTFTAGNWELLTLCYSPTNTALFIGTNQAASGAGLPSVPQEVASLTSLVIGSDPIGQNAASGYIDELGIFSGSGRFSVMRPAPFGLEHEWQVFRYYAAYAPTAALGPVSDEELAPLSRALMSQGEWSGSEDFNSPYGPLDSGCVSGGPVYITNVTAYLVESNGTTIEFDVVGGDANVLYQVFTTANLVGNSITNAQWSFITNSYTCWHVVLTDQPNTQSYYVLGDPRIDPDGDGLSTAYELLVSKTDPNLYNFLSTDGLIPDAWYVAHGLNPNTAGLASMDSDGDSLSNLQEYLGGTDPQSPQGFAIWVAQPAGNFGLP